MTGNGIDSRIIGRSVFVVDTNRKLGVLSWGIGQLHFTENVDIKKEALS